MTLLLFVPMAISFIFFRFIYKTEKDLTEVKPFIALILLTSLASGGHFLLSLTGIVLPGLIYLLIPWGFITGGYLGNMMIKS
ncbi:MAG: hypothetical protein VX730_08545 [Pseudomonadota bacterium]|nr:hypothetical protein [Pseudomonadota bacterium]